MVESHLDMFPFTAWTPRNEAFLSCPLYFLREIYLFNYVQIAQGLVSP